MACKNQNRPAARIMPGPGGPSGVLVSGLGFQQTRVAIAPLADSASPALCSRGAGRG